MEKDINPTDATPLQDGLPLDEEKIEEIVQLIEGFIEQDKQKDAIQIFSQLRPGDQGEVIKTFRFRHSNKYC